MVDEFSSWTTEEREQSMNRRSFCGSVMTSLAVYVSCHSLLSRLFMKWVPGERKLGYMTSISRCWSDPLFCNEHEELVQQKLKRIEEAALANIDEFIGVMQPSYAGDPLRTYGFIPEQAKVVDTWFVANGRDNCFTENRCSYARTVVVIKGRFCKWRWA